MGIKNVTKRLFDPRSFALRTFCPHGCFVPRKFCLRTFCPSRRCLQILCRRVFFSGCFVPSDVLSLRMFCPGTICFPDVLSYRTFCPSGCFVSGRFDSGRFVWVPSLQGSEVFCQIFCRKFCWKKYFNPVCLVIKYTSPANFSKKMVKTFSGLLWVKEISNLKMLIGQYCID
jgi:hypothetical protein